MRVLLALGGLLVHPLTAAADPRCASLGTPSYTATRLTTAAPQEPQRARVFFAGPRIRIEAPGPTTGQMVTLITPELRAIFLTTAEPPVALRMPSPPRQPPPGQDHRQREERSPGRVTFITEARGASGQWHEVDRTTCRLDGVLLEARHWQPQPGGGVTVETRHTEIRLTPLDAGLFRLPERFRLAEPPSAPRR